MAIILGYCWVSIQALFNFVVLDYAGFCWVVLVEVILIAVDDVL